MSRVLWLSNETPDMRGQGGQRRQYFQIEAATAAGHAVTVATLAGDQSHDSLSLIAEVVRLPSPHRRFLPRAGRAKLYAQLFARPFDRIVVAHTESWLTWRQHLMEAAPPILVDMHNVLSTWHAAHGRLEEAQRWASVEREIRARAERVAVCSERERAALEQHSRTPFILEHGISPQEWATEPEPAPTPVIKLFGNWDWAPNRAGLEWFLTEVWPRLLEETTIRCVVAGAVSDELPSNERLAFAGRVESIPRFLSDAWIVGLPVREGVGAPVKFAEALASGVPVLGTTDAVPAHSELTGLVADSGSSWAGWIKKVLDEPDAHRIRSSHARARALSELSWSQVTRPLLRWLDA